MTEANRAPTSLVRALIQNANQSDQAILVGNRAGVVEWANDAWTRLTGFPISETVSKPITHFLQLAQIELELVDFVGQHFREGQTCRLRFPFETFDERTIQVHLEVQPIRNEAGDISDFVAIATGALAETGLPNTVAYDTSDTSDTSQVSPAARAPITDSPSEPTTATASAPALPNLRRVSVSAIAEIGAERFQHDVGDRTHFDVSLGKHLPAIRTHRILLEELVQLLLGSAFHEIDESWGFVSLSTGRLPGRRAFSSEVHGLRTVLPEDAPDRFVQFIEVHDTGEALSEAALDSIRLGVRLANPRAQRLATAAALAPTLGAELLVDSTPGCGTQALLLLPSGAR